MFDIVVAVVDDFWFDNGDNAGFLAFQGVLGENLAVDLNGDIGRSQDVALVVETDFEGGTPFGETETHLVVILESGRQAV